MGKKNIFVIIKKPKAPAQSPDINPIEYVWHALKEYIRKKVPANLQELERGVTEFCATLTPESCNRYISTLQKTIKIVIRKGGRWSNK